VIPYGSDGGFCFPKNTFSGHVLPSNTCDFLGDALDFNDGMLPFHRRTNGRQPSKTIETNGCLTPKPSKNH